MDRYYVVEGSSVCLVPTWGACPVFAVADAEDGDRWYAVCPDEARARHLAVALNASPERW